MKIEAVEKTNRQSDRDMMRNRWKRRKEGGTKKTPKNVNNLWGIQIGKTRKLRMRRKHYHSTHIV